MEIVFEATHSHLYPGHKGKVVGTDLASLESANATCRIDFADGGVVFGSLTHADGDDWMLDVGPYTTAAGTNIPAKRWHVNFMPAGDSLQFCIRKKMAG